MRSLLSRPFENQHCVFLGVSFKTSDFSKSMYTPSETICGLSLREREKFSCPVRRFIRKGAEEIVKRQARKILCRISSKRQRGGGVQGGVRYRQRQRGTSKQQSFA